MRRFLLLAIAFIAYGSLYPFHFEFTEQATHPLLTVWQGWPISWDRFVVRDVVLNLVLYAPVAFAVATIARRRHSRRLSIVAAIAVAFALSTSMELLQTFIPGRDASSLDVLANTVGGAIGAVAAVLSQRRMRLYKLRKPSAPAAIILALWALQKFYPFLPDIGRTHVSESLHAAFNLRDLRVSDVWLGVGEWLALGAAIQFAFGRARTAWLVALTIVGMGAQMAIAGRNLSGWEPISAAIALLLWHFVPATRRPKWFAWILGSGIILRQLEPFYFLSVPQGFSWIPFAATFQASRDSSVAVVARKAFDYGATIFLLRHAGWKYLSAAALVVLVLAATEAIQTYLPGRTPEITDPALALLIAAVLVIGQGWKANA